MDLDSLLRHLHLPPKRIILWHSVAAVPLATLVALGAYLSYHYHVLADQNRERVNRSYQLLDGVDGLFSSLEAAALAERDFVITGDGESFQMTALRSPECSANDRFDRSCQRSRNRRLRSSVTKTFGSSVDLKRSPVASV